jgi:Ca2+-binding EF-hand superfamily protein
MFRILTTTLLLGFLPVASAAGVLQQTGASQKAGMSQRDWPADLNGDGKLSLAEMQASCRQVVMAADTDNDGRISVREWAEAARNQKQRLNDLGLSGWRSSSDDIFVRVDVDRDGFVTAAEVDAASLRRFNLKDVNQDGFITFDEASRGIQRASQP